MSVPTQRTAMLATNNDVLQGSDEWLAERRGMVTASVVGRLITARYPTAVEYACPACEAPANGPCRSKVKRAGEDGAPIKGMHPERVTLAAGMRDDSTRIIDVATGDDARNLTALLAAERITGYSDPVYMSDDMYRGTMEEPLAADVRRVSAQPLEPTQIGLSSETLRAKRLHYDRIRNGLPPVRMVDATPARDHLQKLRRMGMSQRSIAVVTGIPRPTLGELIWRTDTYGRDQILSTTETAILTARFTVAGLPDKAYVSATGSKRRIKALQRMGWPSKWIAQQLGMEVGNLQYVVAKAVKVTVARHKAIAAIYDTHADTHGPSELGRKRNAAKGVPGPAAWDDIDDPDEQPQGVRAKDDNSGVRDTIRELAADGLGHDAIAARAGVSVRTVQRTLGRIGGIT